LTGGASALEEIFGLTTAVYYCSDFFLWMCTALPGEMLVKCEISCAHTDNMQIISSSIVAIASLHVCSLHQHGRCTFNQPPPCINTSHDTHINIKLTSEKMPRSLKSLRGATIRSRTACTCSAIVLLWWVC
jgi:hypothetical protein